MNVENILKNKINTTSIWN